MRRICKVVLLVSVFVAVMVFTFTIYASAEVEESKKLYTDGVAELLENAGDDVEQALAALGFEDFSPEELADIGIEDVFSMLWNTLRGGLKEPGACMLSVLGVMILTSVAGCYISEKGEGAKYFRSVSCLFAALIAFSGVAECITGAVAALYTVGGLMKILIPVMAVITAAAGNPALAVSYNGVALYSAEIISALCYDFLSPVLCIFAAVAVCAGVNPAVNITPALGGVKKLVNVLLGLFGTVFTGILAVKDVLSAGIDRVSVRGVKFILGSAVPVVGGAVSDGLSSVLAAVALMKSAYGIIGLIIIALVTLPSLCNLLAWSVCMSLGSYAADSLGQKELSGVLESLRYVLSTLFSVTVFAVYIAIVSTGLVILISGSSR